jgi:serine/threonine protein phosphatase PrpC
MENNPNPAQTTTSYLERDMQVAEILVTSQGSVGVVSRRCPDRSGPNDDSAAVIQTPGGNLILIVADGVGGCPLGFKASAIAIESIAERTQNQSANEDLRPAILDGIEHANRAILDLGVGAATTLSVVDVSKGQMRGYQVGDSVALLIGQRGALKWKSSMHSPVGYALESGLIDEDHRLIIEHRHIVSNLLGNEDMHIEVGPTRDYTVRDTIIVGSDGLFDNASIDSIVELGRCGQIGHRMESLVALATQHMQVESEKNPGKPDDLALLVFVPA